MFSQSIAYLADDGEPDAGTVTTRFGDAWRRWLVAVCATVFLIGTEESARAGFGHPAADAGFASASGSRVKAAHRNQGRPRCSGCGAIVAKREVSSSTVFEASTGPTAAGNLQPATYYEFTLRLPDGSTRLITASNAEAWREGERVSVIEIETMKLAKR
jgi:hypothetical protein